MIADVDEVLNTDRRGVAEMMSLLRSGYVRALARALSFVEGGGGAADALIETCRTFAGDSLRVGVTGAPGAGKRTLGEQRGGRVGRVGAWKHTGRESGGRGGEGVGRVVCLLAVPPSSPFTGGALLGDRIR